MKCSLRFSLLALALVALTSSAYAGSWTQSGDRIAMGYFSVHDNFTVSDIPWEGYNTMAFEFAQSDNNLNVVLQGANAESILDQFVSVAHAHNVKALVDVGDNGNSTYWSSSVATPQNRSIFAANIARFVYVHDLDGIVLDWEYPGTPGFGCTKMNPNDTINYLEFIKELRRLGPNLILVAIGNTRPFLDATGKPMSDVSDFAKVLDWIEIEVEAFAPSSSSITGPIVPLNDSCSSYQNGSFVSAVASWTKAGLPANQIVLAVLTLGFRYSVPRSIAVSSDSQLQIYIPFNKDKDLHGDAWWDGLTDVCGKPTGPNGVLDFWAIVGYGYLNSDGSVASGMLGTFDQCSQTPYVYDPQTEILVAYDDPKSCSVKGRYIAQAGVRGFSMFEVGGDYNCLLVDAINKAM